ncbi:hypothetical protein G647_05034 [Cladophialophora carrionii CBS 160.54]|uniref:Uncharacterized protein n=1 Tax=Cladophialophora carrionii CBS 160.54 TaxID=1279043 RepID=V9D964_9EURO|nr:uncharacterized protein G647_05034 [Cladophialophora carrionii CBS 160.54]ETI23236.1 hypothetical protein G647_05034 [Cladophialophora carrionii CBS 160.54]
MPDYGKVTEKRRTSYFASAKQWLQLKKYQYEVTFSLYMLTPTEKFIFNFILFLLVSLLVTAATLYLPSHIGVIYNRMSYYVHGEYAYNTAAGPSGEAISSIANEGLKITSEALKSGATPMSQAVKEL